MPEIIQITSSNRHLVKFFLDSAGNILEHFRYFSSRSLDVIDNHIATFVMRQKKEIIGYGHLDPEGETVWLGIAVAENYQGMGLGKLMMNNLLITARILELKSIRLSVDKDNRRAIQLYQQMGFEQIEEKENICFLQINL